MIKKIFVKKIKLAIGKITTYLKKIDAESEYKFTKDLLKHDNYQIGDYTYGPPVIGNSSNRYHLYIGKFCSIANGVIIMIDGNHRVDFITTYPLDFFVDGIDRNPNNYSLKGDVRIGNDVWIGNNVTILPGITIGDGAVIGAGAVVTKNVMDYEIVGGVPAKHIRYRFTDRQIKLLKEIQWWNWPIEKIRKYSGILQSSDIETLSKLK